MIERDSHKKDASNFLASKLDRDAVDTATDFELIGKVDSALNILKKAGAGRPIYFRNTNTNQIEFSGISLSVTPENNNHIVIFSTGEILELSPRYRDNDTSVSDYKNYLIDPHNPIELEGPSLDKVISNFRSQNTIYRVINTNNDPSQKDRFNELIETGIDLAFNEMKDRDQGKRANIKVLYDVTIDRFTKLDLDFKNGDNEAA